MPNLFPNTPHSDYPVDIVIPTRGRGALIDATLASLRRSTHQRFDIWVIDQSDDDRTEQAVLPHSQADGRVHYTRTRSRGISPARNEGIAAGQAPFVFFTDDDCIVTETWMAVMLDEIQAETVSAVFGRVLPDESHPPPPGFKPVSKAIPMALKGTPQRLEFSGNRFNLGFGHGASMGLRRTVLEAVGGFDNLLGGGCRLRSWDDRDMGFRILDRGGKIVYTPQALVYHRHWRDWKQVKRSYCDYAFGAGAAVGKYVRSGDPGSLVILFEWVLDQGLRQALSGLIKWQSWQKFVVGMIQVVYPWLGLMQGTRYPVDRQRKLYVEITQ